VNVSLTANGKKILSRLTRLHEEEARRIQELLGAREDASSTLGDRRTA
jgi:DNA-binding MarR family transcriptional regulator